MLVLVCTGRLALINWSRTPGSAPARPATARSHRSKARSGGGWAGPGRHSDTQGALGAMGSVSSQARPESSMAGQPC